MISILALVVGLLGMFGLWWLAWQLLMQALATPPSPGASNSDMTESSWRNESTPERSSPPTVETLIVPPAWPQPEPTEIEEIPFSREHSNSSANTAFFNRAEIAALVDSKIEKTEILHDDDVIPEPALATPPPPQAPKRKTVFFPGPPPPRMP
jgi:cytoskeletal protein RodZ